MRTLVNALKPYEVWVTNIKEPWRFNACFDSETRAEEECRWYQARGYFAEVRGAGIEGNYSDGCLEYPEGSGG